ncbi:thioredoxin family protein [Chitinophaga silvisoli]|uniref:Thioredoxin family protein n=1 Tax=Chitinophaga silvisoli TaxID=2291814 RepID=A0A3E1P7E4_9BACT|nr:thioredoxin family protein [Chitinophaga silvisoli]RFM36082.1 thioredoxin family protein [Chitinophaga silvisoli]
MKLLLFLLICTFSAKGQVLQNPDKAFAQAAQSGRNIMLVFSGSDWCIPCIQFEKNILSDSSFLRFAQDKLVLLEADFPQRKKIAQPLRDQYDSLAAAFNPKGSFPQVVLLSPGKKLMANVPVKQETPERFINTLKQLMQ